jgi:serine protease
VSKNTRKLRLRGIVAATTFALAAQAAFAAGAQPAQRVDLSAIQSGTQFDRFIVKYRAGTPEASNPAELSRSLQVAAVGANQLVQASRIQRGERAAPGKPLAASHVRRMALGADVVATSQKLGAAEAETLMRQIAANPNVEYVQIDRVMTHMLTPNDTRYAEQWGYTDADAGIRANTAWDVANGSGVIVAVLDTGYVAHTDLAANIVAGYDFITSTTVAGDGNGRDSNPADPGDYSGGNPSSWHGTHVAGTVAAVTNNAKGVAGTAWGAKVMPVRVLGRGGGSTSDIADAIIWASGGAVSGVPTLSAANAADVINMSLGGGGSCDATTQAAINSAVSRGTTVVVAAGNSNANASGFTPASCNNVINVASVTSASARSSFSNYGTLIDVSAPGSGILSTLNAGTQGPGAESYASYNGTSMASPHVAGAVALVQSRRLALGLAMYTPAQVEAQLKATAYALAGACSGGCGAGIINAKALVDAAGGTTPPPPPPPTGTTYTNTADYQIRDNLTVDSPITVSGRTGNASSTSSVSVNIVHTYKGDLKVDLVAPDGTLYNIHNRTGSSTDNVIGTFSRNLSSELLNGTWKLRVNDNAAGDIGYINSWSITF